VAGALVRSAPLVLFYKYYPDSLGGKYIAVAVKAGEARSVVLTAYLTKSIRTGFHYDHTAVLLR
jgi:hypothetical protein